jgi:hypothetical protein
MISRKDTHLASFYVNMCHVLSYKMSILIDLLVAVVLIILFILYVPYNKVEQIYDPYAKIITTNKSHNKEIPYLMGVLHIILSCIFQYFIGSTVQKISV